MLLPEEGKRELKITKKQNPIQLRKIQTDWEGEGTEETLKGDFVQMSQEPDQQDRSPGCHRDVGDLGQVSLLSLGLFFIWTGLGIQAANSSQLGLSLQIHTVPSRKGPERFCISEHWVENSWKGLGLMREDQALQQMWKENTVLNFSLLFISFLHLQGVLIAAENQSLLCKNEIAIFETHSSFGQDMKSITSDWKYSSSSSRGGQAVIT